MASRKSNSTTTRATTAKKPATPTVSRISPVSPSAPQTSSSAAGRVKTITQAERQRLIEQAAYFRAEKSGFQGNAQEYWNAAEAEISKDLVRKKIRVV